MFLFSLGWVLYTFKLFWFIWGFYLVCIVLFQSWIRIANSMIELNAAATKEEVKEKRWDNVLMDHCLIVSYVFMFQVCTRAFTSYNSAAYLPAIV